MADHVDENFRGGRYQVQCPYCNLHPDSQEEILTIVIKEHIQNLGKYENIFEDEISPDVIKKITQISNLRKQHK